MPSAVYGAFHSALSLRSLEFAECVNSWVKEAWRDHFVIQTYAKSTEHLSLKCSNTPSDSAETHVAVFKITPFVQKQLEAVRKQVAESKADENLERLRKSTFTTFVYIAEDLRNGLFKIGQSQTPEKREKTIQSEVPQISMRFYIPAHDSAERELHVLFAEKRVRGEWFALTSDELLSVVGFLKQHGDGERATVDYEWLGKISFGTGASSC